MATPATANSKWVVIDAQGQTLGRLASRVAYVLRGKHKTNFTPHIFSGDKVIVINADKVRMTGTKMTGKSILRHTGYPGGQRSVTPREVLAKHPGRLVEMAVKGMLPKNKMGNELYSNLHVYGGETHPHQAQNPELMTLTF